MLDRTGAGYAISDCQAAIELYRSQYNEHLGFDFRRASLRPPDSGGGDCEGRRLAGRRSESRRPNETSLRRRQAEAEVYKDNRMIAFNHLQYIQQPSRFWGRKCLKAHSMPRFIKVSARYYFEAVGMDLLVSMKPELPATLDFAYL